MIKIGDIIEFDMVAYLGADLVKQYGIVETINEKADTISVKWFDPEAYEHLGKDVSSWSYGLMWRKAR